MGTPLLRCRLEAHTICSLPFLFFFFPWFSAKMAYCAEDECVICLEPFGSCRLSYCNCPAKHTFHYKCIKPWVAANHSCPLCRAAVPRTYRYRLPPPFRIVEIPPVVDLTVPTDVAVQPAAEAIDLTQLEAESQMTRLSRIQRRVGADDVERAIAFADAMSCSSTEGHDAAFERRAYPRRRQRCKGCNDLQNELFRCKTCKKRYCQECTSFTSMSVAI